MSTHFEKQLLEITGATSCKELEVIQSLWSGYGKISRYELQGAAVQTVVVKCIALGNASKHPRGWDTDFSHRRKVKSYEVETCWYEKWSQQCTNTCKVPTYLGTFQDGDEQWIILEDLQPNYPLVKAEITFHEVKTCLKWLAHFHATFLESEPTGLWSIGTYWHLDTRPDEYENIQHEELKEKAFSIDEVLNSCKYKTLVHGDAKLANFCFSENGDTVASVDFQYVGGGCGMKDVAYFLGSCLTGDEMELYEAELLHYYFQELRVGLELKPNQVDVEALESEWREMYRYSHTDFVRFLLGWMPSHQKINDHNLKLMEQVLSEV